MREQEAEWEKEFLRTAQRLKEQGLISGYELVRPPDEVVAAEARELLDEVARQLAVLGPPGWTLFKAVFSFTVSAERAALRFWAGQPQEALPLPEPVAGLVRAHRHMTAGLPDGPWLRMFLSLLPTGTLTVDFDYGDRPLPDEHLFAPQHYRDDIAAYPRARVPAWLQGYIAGSSDAPTTLDVVVAGRRLRADARAVVFNGVTVSLDQVAWVRYERVAGSRQRLLGGARPEVRWAFSLGLEPFGAAPRVDVEVVVRGTDSGPPPWWEFLVRLSERHVEPRLLRDLDHRVVAGVRPVEIGGLRVHRDGVGVPGGPGGSERWLGWHELGGEEFANGHFVLYPAGASQPAFTASMWSPNVVLLPKLLRMRVDAIR
ncbi:hypothetical protein ACOBQX_05760 [Actinokineospora sp. G85]|uniref:hypothetical protein n=1 Tax=Actinokineospora sp. G85 TaxID=3406626 RepID=UPI003C7466AE